METRQIKLFASLFISLKDAYAVWDKTSPRALKKEFVRSVLKAHLKGQCRVGSYLIQERDKARHLIFDIDRKSRKTVRKIHRHLRKLGIPNYVERSKSKGFHIWVFFESLNDAAIIRRLGHLVLATVGEDGIEIFPKQDRVTAGGLGNCIWLPLFPSDAEKNRTVFLDKQFDPFNDQWAFLCRIKKVSSKKLRGALAALEANQPIQRFPRLEEDAVQNRRLAPCAQAILLKGVDKGNRNIALFTLAKHLRNTGADRAAAEELVSSANSRCRPPLDEVEVAQLVKSVFTKKYKSLGCDDTFIFSLCGNFCPVKKKLRRKAKMHPLKVIAGAQLLPEIHPAQTFHNGTLYLGARIGKNRFWVNSHRQILDEKQMKSSFRFENGPTMSQWAPASIEEFVTEQKQVSIGELFKDVFELLNSHIRFRRRWQATLIAVWIMATYLHRLFAFFGYLHITSPGKRAGKSRLLEILSSVAFNATSVITAPTEASLYRDTALNASTQILDESESLRGADQETKAGLMAILNCGFKAGATVPRFNMKLMKVEYLNVYCARAIAGINSLTPTLADRCLRVFLTRKLPHEKIARFNERQLGKHLQSLRDSLHVFALQYAERVAKVYEQSEELRIPEKADDRARDILEPLFSIAALIDDEEGNQAITNQLIVAAGAIAKDRTADEREGDACTAALEILAENFPKHSDVWKIRGKDILPDFTRDETLSWVQRPDHLARILRQLGFRSGTRRRGQTVFCGYAIQREVLEDLCKRYGIRTA